MNVIKIAEKLATFSEHWSPRVIGELNGQHVKVAKLLGEFDWHHHENEDELFLVINGELDIHVRENDTETVKTIGPGEFLIIPRMIEHKPVANNEVELLLFEPASTRNTGNVSNERTIESDQLKSV